jgi:hypothetical protein
MWTRTEPRIHTGTACLGSEPDREDLTEDVMERVMMTAGSHTSRMTDELDDTCLQIMEAGDYQRRQ